MKIYFYGSTLKAAEKKCGTFITSLLKKEPEDKKINVTSICTPCFKAPEKLIIPNRYRFHVFCEYNIMAVN